MDKFDPCYGGRCTNSGSSLLVCVWFDSCFFFFMLSFWCIFSPSLCAMYIFPFMVFFLSSHTQCRASRHICLSLLHDCFISYPLHCNLSVLCFLFLYLSHPSCSTYHCCFPLPIPVEGKVLFHHHSHRRADSEAAKKFHHVPRAQVTCVVARVRAASARRHAACLGHGHGRIVRGRDGAAGGDAT